MRFIWTIDTTDGTDSEGGLKAQEPLTREFLKRLLGCNINSIYKYEALIRRWVDDARKYYTDEKGNEKKWVELNFYLGWLILKVWQLKNEKKGRNVLKQVEEDLFNYPERFSEKAFEQYVKEQREKRTVYQQPNERREQQYQERESAFAA